MKVGDKVLCKKMCIYDYDKPHIKFRKGEAYQISTINKEGIYIYSAKSDGLWFNIRNSNSKNKWYLNTFEDHFYSAKELRKLKLDQLNF